MTALLSLTALIMVGWKYILILAASMWAGNHMSLLYMAEKGITDEDLDGK